MAAQEEAPGDLAEELGDASNILLLAPAMDSATTDVCDELLTIANTSRENLLCIDLTTSPDQRIASVEDRIDGSLAELAFVTIGDDTRSAGTQSVPGNASIPRIETVNDPRDLTGIGIAITETLEKWHGSPNRVVVCFDSLTTLVQYTDKERIFRFLHVVTGHMRDAGAVAHYHMDPGAHDERTVNMLKSLFDAVVEVDGNEWTVSSR